MPERCNGMDPAYPGLKCYLDKGHENYFLSDCEFTDANGERWRKRALIAEKLMWDQLNHGSQRDA